MAPSSTSSQPLARGALPSHILFEEQDGIYWLRGSDLERAKRLLGLRVEGTAAGFDRLSWSIYVGELSKQKIAVGIRQGNVVRTVHLQRTRNPRPLQSTRISLTPTQLFGRAELGRFERALVHKDATRRATLDRIDEELGSGHSAILAEFGDLYAYEVAENIYEVDWELTMMAPSTVELVALAAHRAGHRLPCRLVVPRPRRGNGRRTQPVLQLAEPVPYGQLSLPL